jgi:hypothetical protein
MRVVHQTVEDTIGDRGIANLLVPTRDRQLGSEDLIAENWMEGILSWRYIAWVLKKSLRLAG